MQSPKPRELIVLRREEANACIHYGLYNAASLTACSGIEMLVKTLYDELINTLRQAEPSLAEEFEDGRSEKTDLTDPTSDWGLGKWISFYDDFGILHQLSRVFNYKLSTFTMTSLRQVNNEWNACKHKVAHANPITARKVCGFLNDYLVETKHTDGEAGAHLRTLGELSDRWISEWEDTIRKWLVLNHTAPQAMILQSMSKLLILTVSLITDRRVNVEIKRYLMVAANYVISSVDLIPESNLDVRGLVDDGAVLTFTLLWLRRKRGLKDNLLIHHWPKDSDVIDELDRLEQHLKASKDLLFSQSKPEFGDNLVWATLRKIETEGPEALWQNYWKEAY